MSISRNTGFYSVGLPSLFFMPVTNWGDPQVVDWVALARAYSGLADENGQVINGKGQSTCMTPNAILEAAYVGNLTSSDVGGEIKSVEHTASNMGRKEIDKVVVTRRSIEYTCGFDEINPQNMRNFFCADDVGFPTKDVVIGRTTARYPQTAAVDFAIGPIDIIENGLSSLGENLYGLEMILTEKLAEQNANMGAVTVSATDTYLAGVYYFIVADLQRNPEVDSALTAYRNKIICAFFKYDPVEGVMKVQPWPATMASQNFSYADTKIHARIKHFVNDTTANIGVVSNNSVDDRTVMSSYNDTVEWAINATDVGTHGNTISMPPHVIRNSSRIIIQGKRWDGTAWIDHTDILYDATQDALATDLRSPLRNSADNQYFIDSSASYIDYKTGEMKFTAHPDMAGAAGDMDQHGLTEQPLFLQIESYSASANKILWSGVVWGRDTEIYSTMRVNRGEAEREGAALIMFRNNIGVSFAYMIPRAVFRPDGTIDFSKDDWQAGSFILTALKSDTAYIPDLPSKLRIPFGYMAAFRITTQS